MRQEDVVPQKWDISCGAATLATILTFQLGIPTTEREVAEGMLRRTSAKLVKTRGGFSLLDLKRYAQSKGLDADGYSEMTVDDLQDMAPLIVPMNVRGNDHFVVFRGLVNDKVVLADPAYGNRVMGREEFERNWKGTVGFVIVDPKEPKPPNRMPPRASDFLGVSNDVLRSTIIRPGGFVLPGGGR